MKQRKKVRPGNIELDKEQPIVIVHYEMQIIEEDEQGTETIKEKQQCQKRFINSSRCVYQYHNSILLCHTHHHIILGSKSNLFRLAAIVTNMQRES